MLALKNKSLENEQRVNNLIKLKCVEVDLQENYTEKLKEER